MLIILRRLAEDIHLYESGLDQKRKKEMATALNEQIHDVISFILLNLEVSKLTMKLSCFTYVHALAKYLRSMLTVHASFAHALCL